MSLKSDAIQMSVIIMYTLFFVYYVLHVHLSVANKGLLAITITVVYLLATTITIQCFDSCIVCRPGSQPQ